MWGDIDDRSDVYSSSSLFCSGLMYPDTDLGENARHEEVFNEQAETYVFPRVQTAGGSHYLMHRYSWIRPHQFNGGLAPAVAEEKLNVVSGMG
ncbi:hypothetical protein GTP56_25800 [Duganella sp. FT134W]|uniref:Uncharacterized protein n=1 Tax=Duganella margarita TaxID=2692170 RepID=A0A7X4H692_9BURK|nr:hypothetical protein [Duganella margarita]